MKSLITKEVVFWLQKPITYVYLLAFSGLAFLSMAGSLGLFDSHNSKATIKYLNSGFELNAMLHYLMKLVMFVLPAIAGLSIYRDFSSGAFEFIYSYPISKAKYLLTKCFGSIFIILMVVFALGLGSFLGESVIGLDPSKLGPLKINDYAYFFLLIAIPNVIIYGLLVFMVVAFSRNIYAGFTVVLLLIALQSIIENAFGNDPYLIALLDPFAENTIGYITRYWSLEEKNSLDLPFVSFLIYNRVIWLLLTTAISFFLYRKFNLGVQTWAFHFRKIRNQTNDVRSEQKTVFLSHNITLEANGYLRRVIVKMISWDVQYVLTHWIFLALVLFALASFFFAITKVTNSADFALLPVTKLVLYLPSLFFAGITTMVTFLYSGLLIHRERMAGIDQLTHSSNVPTAVIILNKTLSLMVIQLVLLLVLFVAGVIVQLTNGFTDIDFLLYFQQLILILFPYLLIWALVSIFVHTMIPNLYLGLFILVLGWVGVSGLPQIGVSTRLLLFNGDLILPYSDLSGYGAGLYGFMLVKVYWFLFACIALILGYLFWKRELTFGLKDSYHLLVKRLTLPTQFFMVPLISGFIFSGWLIYQGESEMIWKKEPNQSKLLKEFNSKFDHLKSLPQPKIFDIDLNLNIYPEEYRFNANGTFKLANKTNSNIDTILIRSSFDEITSIFIDHANLVEEDSLMHFYVYKLKKSLAPSDTIDIHFTVNSLHNTAFERNSNVLRNATFLKSDFLPKIGFLRGSEIPSPLDSMVRNSHYQAQDSDFLNLNTSISTSSDQIALAPGTLKGKWVHEGRNHYNYHAQNIKSSFDFHSGNWMLSTSDTLSFVVKNYHHKKHDYNLKQMSNGVIAALNHNEKRYSPFEHEGVRIIEFSDIEGTYASAFANNMAVSEARYIANIDTAAGAVDITFYVAAHELTHHWWGSQVLPAHAEGALMLSESITEYNTLNIYRDHYGKQRAFNFLKLQRERYLKGRTRETGEEQPLAFVHPDQQYIAYGKGAMVFNALSHYIGNDSLYSILKNFLKKNKYQGPPYPTSLDFVDLVKQSVPDSLKAKVTELFEAMTIHELSLITASKTAQNGLFTINAEITYNKKIVSREGYRVGLTNFDWVEIGLFDEADRLVETRDVRMEIGVNTVSFKGLTFEPYKFEIDPNLLLIDLDLEDNAIWF